MRSNINWHKLIQTDTNLYQSPSKAQNRRQGSAAVVLRENKRDWMKIFPNWLDKGVYIRYKKSVSTVLVSELGVFP